MLKYALEADYIHFQCLRVKLSPLKTLSNWAIFTTQLILRLKLSVMKRVVQPQETIIAITVWEE